MNDIADHGNARAEEIDGDLGSDAATQVANLVLSASLSRAVGAHTGLTQVEIVEYLLAPYRKADELLAGLDRLRDRAWYPTPNRSPSTPPIRRSDSYSPSGSVRTPGYAGCKS